LSNEGKGLHKGGNASAMPGSSFEGTPKRDDYQNFRVQFDDRAHGFDPYAPKSFSRPPLRYFEPFHPKELPYTAKDRVMPHTSMGGELPYMVKRNDHRRPQRTFAKSDTV
jgi:hypothetical protein